MKPEEEQKPRAHLGRQGKDRDQVNKHRPRCRKLLISAHVHAKLWKKLFQENAGAKN